jgi:signal transduction histidine kinase
VTDRGKGISENEQPQVFKKFYRIENEETRTTKGTGLGLYLVYNFVDILKGRITINSSEMGTVFTVSLPEQ